MTTKINNKNIRELKEGEIVIYKKRLLRVRESKYSKGGMQGHRVILKLLTNDEVMALFLELKGG